MVVQHHTFNGAAFGPIGDFIVHASEWTGIDPSPIVALARGAAPESAGASSELDRLVAALANDRHACALLYADDAPGETIARLRELGGAVGAAACEYLDSVGYRLLDSLDVADPYALEVPEVVVRRLRRALEQGSGPDDGPSDDEVAQIRDRVPAAHRDEFDALFAEARLTSRVRDERGIFSEVWAGGIVRRAILAAGELLARDGRIDAGAHLVDAGYGEMRELIHGTGGPSAADLARRAQIRAEQRTAETPGVLGDPPQPPPPLDALPPAAARAMRALDTSIGALFGEAETDSAPTTVRGIAASPGSYTGTARVIYGPEEFALLQPGDVLVTVSTTESFNTVLPLLGALVTDSGGLLSHAAIVSRKYGIPGIVGTRDATTLIPDGALVRVAGDSGDVEVMGRDGHNSSTPPTPSGSAARPSASLVRSRQNSQFLPVWRSRTRSWRRSVSATKRPPPSSRSCHCRGPSSRCARRRSAKTRGPRASPGSTPASSASSPGRRFMKRSERCGALASAAGRSATAIGSAWINHLGWES